MFKFWLPLPTSTIYFILNLISAFFCCRLIQENESWNAWGKQPVSLLIRRVWWHEKLREPRRGRVWRPGGAGHQPTGHDGRQLWNGRRRRGGLWDGQHHAAIPAAEAQHSRIAACFGQLTAPAAAAVPHGRAWRPGVHGNGRREHDDEQATPRHAARGLPVPAWFQAPTKWFSLYGKDHPSLRLTSCSLNKLKVNLQLLWKK